MGIDNLCSKKLKWVKVMNADGILALDKEGILLPLNSGVDDYFFGGV